jgi:unsaturated rhamnogalacturonyl hydrolase
MAVTYNAMHEQQLWDDTLMMSAIPLARIGKLLGRPEYIEEAKYKFLLHVQYLAHSSGLWYHGWRFTESGGDNFAGALWARGNCWITIAIPLLLEILPELKAGDAVHDFLVSALRRQIDALVRTQSAGGLWHTLLVDPTSYVESSASAGFAAGIYMALRMGLVVGQEYRDCADRALAAVIGCIREDGELEQVSFGTGMGDSFQFYKDIPITSMPYGQALAMLALVEWERIQA